MKKLLAIVLGIVLLAASAYAASAFYYGREVETAMADPYKGLEANPYVKLLKRDYQRGVFSSTESVTIELLGDFARATGGAPLLMTARSRVSHGPVPGLSQLAAAAVDTELFVGGAGIPMPGTRVMVARTVVHHDGTGETRGVSPATALEFPDPVVGKLGRIAWDGGDFVMQFSQNMQQYNLQGQSPKFEMGMADGGRVVMSGVRFAENSKAIFPEDTSLRTGTQNMAIGEMSMILPVPGAKPVVMKKITYDTSVPLNGDFIGLNAKLLITDILVAEQNYGPAHLDMSGKNLHARSLLQVQKAMAGMNKMAAPQPGSDPMAAMQPMIAAMVAVLQHDPEVSIDRFSFNTPNGEVLLTAKVRVPGVTAEDASNVMALMQKMDVGAELALPEALLMTTAPPPVQQQVAGLIEQGYAYRDGTMIKSKLEYRAGQVAVNGLPFDPMAMQGRQVPASPIAPPPGRPQKLPNVPVRR